MGNAPIFVSVDGAQRLKRLSKDLRGADKALRRQLRTEIKSAARPVIADVRQAALNVDVSSSQGGTARPDKSTGLRRAVARATGLSMTTRGIRIRVSSKRLARTHNPRLAKYLDASPFGKYRRWRHPVFGNWDVPEPARQQKGEPFFFVTIRRHTKDFRRACDKAMDDVAARISKG